MDCPKCGSGTYVVDSRHKPHRVYRRRECRICGNRFSTAELNEEQIRTLVDSSVEVLKEKVDASIDVIKHQIYESLGINEGNDLGKQVKP